MEAKIIIKGKPVAKKNSFTVHWWQWKNGIKIPRDRPLIVWSDEYKKWGVQAVQQLVVYKKNYHDKIKKPFNIVNAPHFCTFIFCVPDNRIRDISNLYEAPQDVFAGNLGFKISTKIAKTDYQIFKDDDHTIITNHAGSRVIVDKVNPRTEIYISPFTIDQWNEMVEITHPNHDLSHLDNNSDEPDLFTNGSHIDLNTGLSKLLGVT